MTQAAVAEAADTLLVAGERPSPDRVRALIGTGSHEVIAGFLDVWWEGLGRRIIAPSSDPWTPPPEIQQIAAALWIRATAHARAMLATFHEEERERLLGAIARLEARLRDASAGN
ncbi:DNA-binding protein [Frateuria sp. STR12]|uniref:DNA-binding protein n=1 Tax=Frateuria hangzhouensis TaxID=2995589 RepID=UPI002260A102|nr:DNA-binding protein [Frateuria sp. STR12]MCX7513090.1 DNA-binding protein [Frateuria sp. STR12]